MIQILPAILATTEDGFRDDIERLSQAESFKEGDWLHIDVMDGVLVPSKSVGLDTICDYQSLLKIKKFQREAHLMVQSPQVLELIDNGFNRIVLHIESDNIDQTDISMIKDNNLEVGLAINPETDLQLLVPFLGEVDVIQVMGVHPGYQGREFLESTPERIKQVVDLRTKHQADFKVGVDGGIGPENARLVIDSGADYIIVGSRLIKGNIDENYRKLQEAILEK